MSLRGTRQYVEILHAGSGKARVTRQYIEFLESVYTPQEYNADASDSLTLSDEATKQHFRYAIGSDSLALDETAFSNRFYLSVTDALALSDSASRQFVAGRFSTDTLQLAETTKVGLVVYVEAVDFLHLQEAAIKLSAADDALALVDSATRIHVANVSVSDTLELAESADRQLKVYRGPAEPLTHLGLHDLARCGIVVGRSAEDIFDLSESADAIKYRPAVDTLSLSETAEGIKTQHGEDVLSLSEIATANHVYSRHARDLIRLREAAHGGFHYECSATDTLSFDEWGVVERNAIDTLSLSDAANAIKSRPAVDNLELSDSAEAYNAVRRITEVLALAEEASAGKVYYRSAHDSVNLSDSPSWTGPKYTSAIDALGRAYTEYGPGPDYDETIVYYGLVDTAVVTVVKHRTPSPEDNLKLKDSAEAFILNASHSGSATDTLSLSESAAITYLCDSDDIITLDESAVGELAHPSSDSLVLSESAVCSVVFNRLASDDLNLSEATLAAYSNLDAYLCVYHPFVGEGATSNPTPPDTDLEGPIVGITDTFKLVYPVIGPFSDTLVLRAPNLGNRDRLQMNRISRETRGGTLIVFADQMWPKIQTLVLNFSGLSWAEAGGLHTFMDNHLGQEIGLLDWEHRFWSGIISKLDDPITQDGKGCQYSVGFEFEGELATYSP